MSEENQLWITSAVAQKDVERALTLCFSLRRTCTTRKIAIITTHDVMESREAMYHAFDLVFNMEKDSRLSSIEPEDAAKLYQLKVLNAFEKVVFLTPTLLALKNFDDIFDDEVENLKMLNNADSSIILLKPGISKYESIVSSLANMEKVNFGAFLQSWAINQSRLVGMLDSKYEHVISSTQSITSINDDIPIINLKNFTKPSDISHLKQVGFLEGLIAKHWMQIYQECVNPVLTNCSKNMTENLVEHNFKQGQSAEPIAIVGMSCRHPAANNLEDFWQLLFQGEDGTSTPPDFRWTHDQSVRKVPNAENTNAGFLNVPVDEFDGKFFGLSPKEVLFLDPQHRLLHELVWESLEDASIDPTKLRGTPGSVFVGSWINDYKDILIQSGNSEFYRVYMGNSIGACAARISFMLGIYGPSVATESGCSSAMVAVHMACKSLRQKETNLALACGVNLILHPFEVSDLPMVISPEGRSKTFSEDADGFARAEGAGVLVLKRLSDAVRAGDHIWGLIRGTAITQEGLSKSMGTPTIHCESLAMSNALRDAQVTPDQVSYLEAHGTGTVVGDPMEVAAIAKAYKSSDRKNPLIIGSVKTNIGHTESCSGITGIMKVILSLENGIIPAHLNFTKLNPSIHLDAVPAVIPMKNQEWRRNNKIPRIAGVSSFGITGTDGHVIIQEAPDKQKYSKALASLMPERSYHFLKISAKSEDALNVLLEQYGQHVPQMNENLSDICFTANNGRTNFPYKSAFVFKHKDELQKQITSGNYFRGNKDEQSNKKICFLFTGQGSQYENMAKELYDTSPVFRMHFDYCGSIFQNKYNINVFTALWKNSANISQTVNSQTSIFCVEYALMKLWESWGIQPDFALGHSLGEFCAAVCAGILRVENAIDLVAERSILIDALPSGKMLAIKSDKYKVDRIIRKFSETNLKQIIDFAALNSNDQTVVAGDPDAILKLSTYCKEIDIKCVVLEATHAFHSRHMEPILEKYRDVATKIDIHKSLDFKGKCGYISGMIGDFVESPSNAITADYWVRHTVEPVKFIHASQKAVKLGCEIFIEIGPQPVLSALTTMNNDIPLTSLPSLKKNENNWLTMFSTLAQLYVQDVAINWAGLDEFQQKEKVRLPHYPFMRKKCWPDLTHKIQNVVHPLLGSIIENPSAAKIFQSTVNARTHEWITDHKIGNHVILPGAGYLEMFLAGGHRISQGNTEQFGQTIRPMQIENLSINIPLEIEDSKTVQLQTLIEFSSNVEHLLTMKVFQQCKQANDISNWKCHASAEFSQSVSIQNETTHLEMLQVEAFMKNYQSNDDKVEIFYNKFHGLGLNFGPLFKSIETFWDSGTTIITKIKVPERNRDMGAKYIVHPIILDSMIQSILLFKLKNTDFKLFVPIRIGKFVLLSQCNTENSNLYVQVQENLLKDQLSDDFTSNFCVAVLLDTSGNKIAIMTGVEVFQTTVRGIEYALDEQKHPLPDLWEEVWRYQPHLVEESADLDSFSTIKIKETEKMPDSISKLFMDLEKLVYYNMLKSLCELGWMPNLTCSESFSENELFNQLNIHPQFQRQFNYFLRVFEEEGIIRKVDDNTWKLVGQPPTINEIQDYVHSIDINELANQFRFTLLITKTSQHLVDILKGTHSVLGILFPEDKNEPSAADMYREYNKLLDFELMIQQINGNWFDSYTANSSGTCKVLRILEVGAGTGSYTELLLQILESCNVPFEYTYSDISAAFFDSAEKKFDKWASKMTFRKLNIEDDPIDQGFIPGYYDFICASNVVHATKNLKIALNNVKTLLRPGGFFELIEQFQANRFITFIFGLLDGFWRFEDLDVRSDHCTISKEKWCQVLDETGFEIIETHSSGNGIQGYIKSRRTVGNIIKPLANDYLPIKTWLIFHEAGNPVSEYMIKTMNELGNCRHIITVCPFHPFQVLSCNELMLRPNSEQDFMDLTQYIANAGVLLEGILYGWSLSDKAGSNNDCDILIPYMLLSKSIHNFKKSATMIYCTLVSGTAPIENNDLRGFQSSSLVGFTRSFQNEHPGLKCKVIDVGDYSHVLDNLNIFYEIWNVSNSEIFVAYQCGRRYVPKLQPLKYMNTALDIPVGTNRFQLMLPDTKQINDLKFGYLDCESLKSNEVEVEVRASALNFRDVLNVLKPSDYFKNTNFVGFDYAGVITRLGDGVSKWAVGDRVFGINPAKLALPSHVNANQDELLKVPDSLTFCEASTLPAVVMTSYRCLVEVANVKSTDTVLIHAASGGVGLSAIDICQSVGATVIATAGSACKRNYLKNLGVQHVFHSRTTKYLEDIMKVTNGRGVDVVLNSLTSEGFKEATLKACAPGARFVEIGLLSIWSEEEVKAMRPDVFYTVVDLSQSTKQQWRTMFYKVKDMFENKIVRPVPYTRFDALDIRQALTYLQKAKHIGKVVCVMPEVSNVSGSYEIHTPLFHKNASYVITGGLGGIGFEVCKWMLKNGARYILLVSRTFPNTTKQRLISDLNTKYNAQISAVSLDVSSYTECENLIGTGLLQMGYPELKGIMHAAGTLHDKLIEEHTVETFSSTLASKIKGTFNLHQLTKTNRSLEHFVLFSSVASFLGSPGQTNHAAGNCYEDAMAHYRRSMGLPGTSINWGQWGEVGVATDINLHGIRPLTTRQGIAALEYALKSLRVQITANNFESIATVAKMVPTFASYLDERVWTSAVGKNNLSVSSGLCSDEFWKKYDAAKSKENKELVLKECLRVIVRRVLRLDESDIVDDNTNFQEMGVDSLMFVEIKNAIQSLFGNRKFVAANDLKDCSSINMLSVKLVGSIDGSQLEDNADTFSDEDVQKLIKEDCMLPAHIRAAEGQTKISVSDISCVLLTGVTGTLGPYVLKELCALDPIKEIICLIRPHYKISPEKRLEKILKERGLFSHINLAKIRCIAGNVSEDHLSLDKNVWTELCNNVDGIIHCAVRVHYGEKYTRKDVKGDTRDVNVKGLNRLLEFACTGKKLKQVCFASSIVATSQINEDGNMSEDWPKQGDFDGVTRMAYPISKFVCEMLMKTAILERGIPGKVFRFPLIGGDSMSGQFVLDQNHIMQRFLFILKTGVMPSNPAPLVMLPVDVCAKVSVQLFFNSDVPCDVYNIYNKDAAVDQEFVDVAKRLEYNVDIVEFSQFVEMIKQSTTQDSPFALFKDFYQNEEEIMSLYSTAPLLRHWLTEGGSRNNFFASTKIRNFLPEFFDDKESSMNCVYRDILFAKTNGWLDKYVV